MLSLLLEADILRGSRGYWASELLGSGVVEIYATRLLVEISPSLFVSRYLARLSIENWSIILSLWMALLKLQISMVSDLSGLWLDLISSSWNADGCFF